MWAVGLESRRTGMEAFLLILPEQLSIQAFNQFWKGQGAMGAGLSSAGEHPTSLGLVPEQSSNLLVAFGFTLASRGAEGAWRDPLGALRCAFENWIVEILLEDELQVFLVDG